MTERTAAGQAEKNKTLFVVPAERHVERLAREGCRGETRASLRARLAATLLPDVRFADVREVRLTLAVALEEARAAAGQLSLFGGAGVGADEGDDDPLLATLRGRGGASWVRAVAAMDDAIGALRSRGATEAHLARVRGGVAAARARTLAAAMRALDSALGRAGMRDGRLLGMALAPAIRSAGPSAIADVIGAHQVRARWLLAWDPHDLAWWRALDETLARAGRGSAKVILPTFDKRLEGARERDPLEVIADVVARHLDAAPETETIAAVLGDLATTPPSPPSSDERRIRILRAADARDEASVVARLVATALRDGARVERVAIAYPVRDERTLLPLRRALFEEGVVFHDALGAPTSGVPVIAAALHALGAAEARDRSGVAQLLRSGYVDAAYVLRKDADEAAQQALPDVAIVGVDEHHEDEPPHEASSGEVDARVDAQARVAEQTLDRLARVLETHATAAGKDPSERLIRTAGTATTRSRSVEPTQELPDAARRVTEILGRACLAKTRGERVRAARALFHDLGFATRVGHGAVATFASDDAAAGVDRAERIAVARDVRAWDVLLSALDAYESTAVRAGAEDRPLDAEVFRLELQELLDQSAQLPGAGRAGAVRIARLADVAGDELDLLVVLDANDGSLPRDVQPITLVSEALEGAVARVARDGFAAIPAGELAARDLAALAVTAADATRIVFVTTSDDATETPARPSRILAMLERAGVAIEERASRASGAGVRRSKPSHALCHAGEISRRASRERLREGFFLDPSRPASELIGALSVSTSATARREMIRSLVAAETGDSLARALAVTSVERFAQCPFKGYAHVVLAAREGEEQHELPDAREEGNLGHSALAAAFAATRSEWSRRPRDADAILTRGLAAADAALEASSTGHAPLRAIVRLRIRESVRAVLGRAIADETWDFLHAEQAFGNRRTWPALSVSDSDGDESAANDAAARLWLRGSIDRVDRTHDGSMVRVVDYKRSKSTVRDSSASLGSIALQVPLYAVVASRALGIPATGAYHPMQPRDLATEMTRATPTRARSNPEERVSDLARRDAPNHPSEIERRVLDLVVAARGGHFAPVPAREAECTYCSASGGCRKPRFAMAPADELEDVGMGLKEAP